MIHLTWFALLIFHTLAILNIVTQEVPTNDYTQIKSLEFDRNRVWFVESINTNDNHCFHSIFLYKHIAFCLLFEIVFQNKLNRTVLYMYFHSSRRNMLMAYEGPGKFLTDISPIIQYKGCPREKRLELVYTDYLNVVVLKGGDSRSGPHIMVLRSNTTSMTYKERMLLIKTKVEYLFDFKSLQLVQPYDCSLKENLIEEFKTTNLRKCKDFNERKERERVSDMIRKPPLLALAVCGLFWIIVIGVSWFIKKRNRASVAPVISPPIILVQTAL